VVLFHAALLPEATDEVVPSADSEYTTPQLPLSMTEPQTGGAAVENLFPCVSPTLRGKERQKPNYDDIRDEERGCVCTFVF